MMWFLLTVELIKVPELRRAEYCIVEMRFQSTTLQEAIGHLCQVDANYSIWIPKIDNVQK